MKTYTFAPDEFAKLELVLTRANHFLHAPRSEAELVEFQRRIYPLLREVYYRLLGSKIDDVQREAISSAVPDPFDPDLPTDRAVQILASIFET